MSLLEVKDLHTSFFTPSGEVKAVNGLSFSLEKGKVLGIVGESGSGKSVTAYSILQILTSPGRIVHGSIKLHGEELVGKSNDEMLKIRGNKISIMFQCVMIARLENAFPKYSLMIAHRRTTDPVSQRLHSQLDPALICQTRNP